MTTATESLPPTVSTGPIAWVRERLFSSPLNAVLTVLAIVLLVFSMPPFVEWAMIKANFTAATSQECRAGGGACWAFIGVKYRLMLFGLY
ncbi:MAG: amino acid ABC transporter permease, partial [Ferrovibrio sp.]